MARGLWRMSRLEYTAAMRFRSVLQSFVVAAAGCSGTHVASVVPAAALVAKTVPLPGATGPASLDYIAYESPAHGHSRVWVPVGVTGSVDVFDVTTGAFTRVDGFATATREARGKMRTVGPSAV